MRAAKILSSIISVVIKLFERPPLDQLEVTLESSQIVPRPRTWVETTPTPCNQIKIMSFIQTGLAHSESGSQNTTTRYVYNMSLFLVARLLNIWQRTSCPRCLQTKGRVLTLPRSSNPPLPDSADGIVPEIEVCQHRALWKHSCKTLCSTCSDPIGVEIKVGQRCALRQHSCEANSVRREKTKEALGSLVANVIFFASFSPKPSSSSKFESPLRSRCTSGPEV